jgi:diadenosine tetraphosphate (Ap4A) HIT family hydrolase
MEIAPEQLIEIKKQLIEQINSTFPEERKAESIKQIEEMDNEQFVEFLKKNNLLKISEETQNETQCIFCSIIFGEVPSTKIGENEASIAILELNPISEGHSLVIPKKHLSKEEDLEEETERLAKEVSEKIKETLNPKEVKIIPGNIMGHEILNILPIYKNETIGSPRTKKTPEQLLELQEKLGLIYKEEIIEKPSSGIEQINAKDIWLPKRLP